MGNKVDQVLKQDDARICRRSRGLEKYFALTLILAVLTDEVVLI